MGLLCSDVVYSYITTEGVAAFDILADIVNSLAKAGIPMTRADELSNCLKLSRRYLKSDYKVHLGREERCGDHCTVYALSDQDIPAFSSGCNHDHDLGCDRCQLLNDTHAVIETQIDNMAKSNLLTEEQSLQFHFLCRQAVDKHKLKKVTRRHKGQSDPSPPLLTPFIRLTWHLAHIMNELFLYFQLIETN